jgi:transcriptional regulator with PAS, ATPase and Fis domain
MLQMHDWPGNVRELEHAMEGAMLLSKGDVIEPGDLSVRNQGVPASAQAPDGDAASLSLEEMERIHIEHVLRKNGFSRTRTAEDLGISKKTLYLKIKRYGIST